MRKPTDNGIPSTLDTENRPKNRIQVSREAKSVSFFVNLTKKFLQAEEEVELSGLGLAVTPAVTVAEILRNREYVVIKKIRTSLEERPGERRWAIPKARIQIWVAKSDKFHQLIAREQEALQSQTLV
ncbi:hypothetical protein GpartN1_g541.t1 [Galdieria partita]|uniref:DNA/RNA-binding protein Alba-like domain-containing protein n=1 Tax=Galdieria partita TaxID=83374 RepID=A0A9C7PQN2_9RHOD|nr:hypothetical protein GpartN1_g541.t1 [Galdieria partita]